jgi:hypothetical protein
MVKTLNKYGMLFESQPKGYSNVEMKSDVKSRFLGKLFIDR